MLYESAESFGKICFSRLKLFSFFQANVMYPLVQKTVASQIQCSEPRLHTTITAQQEMPGFTSAVLDKTEGLGARARVTTDNGFKQTLEPTQS